MKKIITLFSLIATFALVSLFNVNPVSADELNLDQLDPDEKDVQTITDPDELEPFKEKFGEKEGNKKLEKVTIVEPKESLKEKSLNNNQTLASGYNLKNVSKSNACGTSEIRRSTYSHPGGTMSVSEGVAATYSATGGISAAGITAQLGFDVTKSFGVSDSQKIEVSKGKSKTVKAFPTLDIYNFNVYNGSTKKGSGNAQKPVGICFVQYSN